MIETSKYCEKCEKQLTPATAQSEKEQQFLKAHRFLRGSVRGGPITQRGTCEKCNLISRVTSYYIFG